VTGDQGLYLVDIRGQTISQYNADGHLSHKFDKPDSL